MAFAMQLKMMKTNHPKYLDGKLFAGKNYEKYIGKKAQIHWLKN